MLKIIHSLSVLFFILNTLAYGQSKLLNIPRYSNGDTSYSFTYQTKQAQKAKLQNLIESKDSIHIRFWTSLQAVDIWTKDFHSFHGQITLMTEKIADSYEESMEREVKKRVFISKNEKLDNVTSQQVYALFQKLKIFDIPSDDSLKGWPVVDDGYSFTIELATPTYYSFKVYNNPSSATKVPEANIIDSLGNEIERLLNLSQRHRSFLDKLPDGCYKSSSGTYTCKCKTKIKHTIIHLAKGKLNIGYSPSNLDSFPDTITIYKKYKQIKNVDHFWVLLRTAKNKYEIRSYSHNENGYSNNDIKTLKIKNQNESIYLTTNNRTVAYSIEIRKSATGKSILMIKQK